MTTVNSQQVDTLPAFQYPYYHTAWYTRFGMSQFEVCEMQNAKKRSGCPTTSSCILQYASQHAFLAVLTHTAHSTQQNIRHGASHEYKTKPGEQTHI